VQCLKFQKLENQNFWKEMQEASHLFDGLMASIPRDILGTEPELVFLNFLEPEPRFRFRFWVILGTFDFYLLHFSVDDYEKSYSMIPGYIEIYDIH
jgi:hypothetical protein